MPLDVLGIGTPILDSIIPVTDEFLIKENLGKGGMFMITHAQLEKLLSKAGQPSLTVAGGSACNATKGLSRFGQKCGFIGRIGDDDAGKRLNQRLKDLGVVTHLQITDAPTSQALSLVTPDGQRTFGTYIGANLDTNFFRPELFKNTRLVHIEGYLMTNGNGEFVAAAMQLAKDAGAKISFELSNYEIVHAYRDQMIHLISHYVDVLFANEQETYALTHKMPESAIDSVRDICETAVLSQGKEGCWVGRGITKVHCPAFPVEHPVDTTGAGDHFESGFLHGYLQGLPLEVCARYGALAGAAVVQVMGAELNDEQWAAVKARL